MIAAYDGIVERARTPLIRQLESPEAEIQLRNVQGRDALDDRIFPRDRNRKRALEILLRLTEIPDLGVQHPEVVQHPRQRLGIARKLERAEAVRVVRGRRCKITARVGEHAAVLFDHAEETRFSTLIRE